MGRESSHDKEPEEDGEGEAAVVDEEAEDLAEDRFDRVQGGLLMGLMARFASDCGRGEPSPGLGAGRLQ